MTPVEENETLVVERLFQHRLDSLENVEVFVVRLEEQRRVEQVEDRIDIRQSGLCQGSGMQLTDPHLADHIGIVPGDTAWIDAQGDVAVGGLRPLRGHLTQDISPDRTIGYECRQLEGHRRGRARQGEGCEQNKDG